MQVLGISMSTHLTDVHLGVRPLAERRVIGISPCSLLHLFHRWRVLAGLVEHWLVVHVVRHFIHSDRPHQRLGHFSVIRREGLAALSGQFSDHTTLTNAIVVHLLVVFGLLLTVALQQQVRKSGWISDCVVEGRQRDVLAGAFARDRRASHLLLVVGRPSLLGVCGGVRVVGELQHGVDGVLADRVRRLGMVRELVVGYIWGRWVATAGSLRGSGRRQLNVRHASVRFEFQTGRSSRIWIWCDHFRSAELLRHPPVSRAREGSAFSVPCPPLPPRQLESRLKWRLSRLVASVL